MKKKIIIPTVIIFLLLITAVGFWWQNQKEVRELNKNLSEGVRVVKSLLGKDYKVVNEIDGYEIKVPEEWKGLKEIEYFSERKVEDMNMASLNLEGLESEGRFVAIDCYKLNEIDKSLESWVQELFQIFELTGMLESDKIGNLEVIKTKEEEHLAGIFIYFLKKDSKIYAISGFSEESIREIILNGKW